jgi:hypothetical protein
MNRVKLVLRDKLVPGGLQNPNDAFKDYLLKQSGVDTIPKIKRGDFERLLKELEDLPAAEAAKKVKEGK